jgi:hypothetical protein
MCRDSLKSSAIVQFDEVRNFKSDHVFFLSMSQRSQKPTYAGDSSFALLFLLLYILLHNRLNKAILLNLIDALCCRSLSFTTYDAEVPIESTGTCVSRHCNLLRLTWRPNIVPKRQNVTTSYSCRYKAPSHESIISHYRQARQSFYDMIATRCFTRTSTKKCYI